MRLSIIQPSHYRSKSDRSILKIKKRRLTGLTLPYLAALTPAGWDISLIDEQLTDIDFDAPVDLAAITTWTINSLRAYEIADNFRRRGSARYHGRPAYSTFTGGICRALRCGRHRRGGERSGPSMLDDFANGRLRKFYSAPHSPELADLPMPRYDLHRFFEIHTNKDILGTVLARLPIRVRVLLGALLPRPPLPVPAGSGRNRRDQAHRGALHPVRRQ